MYSNPVSARAIISPIGFNFFHIQIERIVFGRVFFNIYKFSLKRTQDCTDVKQLSPPKFQGFRRLLYLLTLRL